MPPGTFAVLIDQFVDRMHAPARTRFSRTVAAWPMSRWRIRCRRDCAFILLKRRGQKASMLCATGRMSAWKGRNSPPWPKAPHLQAISAIRQWIGMTNMPEPENSAREAEICYATVAMVTDFDCWQSGSRRGNRRGYCLKVLAANAEKANRLMARLAQGFPRDHEPCPIGSDRAPRYGAG